MAWILRIKRFGHQKKGSSAEFPCESVRLIGGVARINPAARLVGADVSHGEHEVTYSVEASGGILGLFKEGESLIW